MTYRVVKVGLALVIVVIVALLAWGLLADSGSNSDNRAGSAGSSRRASVPAQAGGGNKDPGVPQGAAAKTLRQGSLH